MKQKSPIEAASDLALQHVKNTTAGSTKDVQETLIKLRVLSAFFEENIKLRRRDLRRAAKLLNKVISAVESWENQEVKDCIQGMVENCEKRLK